MIKDSIGQYLKVKRIVANVSQVQIAAILGYHTSQYISNWERGVSIPPIPTLKTIGRVYKLDPEELFDLLLKAAIETETRKLHNVFLLNQNLPLPR